MSAGDASLPLAATAEAASEGFEASDVKGVDPDGAALSDEPSRETDPAVLEPVEDFLSVGVFNDTAVDVGSFETGDCELSIPTLADVSIVDEVMVADAMVGKAIEDAARVASDVEAGADDPSELSVEASADISVDMFFVTVESVLPTPSSLT